MKILITGATGFVGSHLCEYLLRLGYDVHGTFIYESELARLPALLRDQVTLHRCDLTDGDQVRHTIKHVHPERVYHLAAISSVHKSWAGRELVWQVNLFGWLHLIEAVQEFCPTARMLMISSSEVYGIVPEAQQPISESQALRPLNPYAASKAAQEMLCYQYIRAYQLPVVIVRPFNHTGPRQVPDFVCPDFARQIAEIEKGQRAPVMRVGNLEARRDFSDVRDIIRAYHLALEKCPPGLPVNIASGTPRTIQSILDALLSFSHTAIEVRQDPERLRPSDMPLAVGDSALLYHYTNWAPEVPFNETLLNVLNYWRSQEA